MIGRLRGAVTRRPPPEVLVEAGGVGYRVLASMAARDALPPDGGEAALVTHLVVRDDAHTLYGFRDEAEREDFCRLLRIPGVGAKTALAIVSALPGEALGELLREGDAAALVRVPGIGRKTAERLLVELRPQALAAADAAGGGASAPEHEAEQALVRLGWKAAEARRMVAALDTRGQDAEGILRAALQGSRP